MGEGHGVCTPSPGLVPSSHPNVLSSLEALCTPLVRGFWRGRFQQIARNDYIIGHWWLNQVCSPSTLPGGQIMWLKATTPLITGWVPPASSSHPLRVTSLAHEAPSKSLISSCVWNQRLRPNIKTEDALVTRFYKGLRSSVSGTGGRDQTCIFFLCHSNQNKLSLRTSNISQKKNYETYQI